MTKVYLYKGPTDNASIFLQGSDGSDPVADKLQLPGSVVFSLVPALTIPGQFLAPITDGKRFQTGATGGSLILTANFTLDNPAGAFTFFGLTLDQASQLSTRLELHVPVGPVSSLQEEPFCVIEVTGRVKVPTAVAGQTIPTGAAFGFAVVIDEVPALPNVLPVPRIRLPDFGLRWPTFRLPWKDAANLSFPFAGMGEPLRLPVLSFLVADLPLDISWHAINISLQGEPPGPMEVILDVFALRIKGRFSAVQGDLHVVIDPTGAPNVAQSTFALLGPPKVTLKFSGWHFDEGCFVVRWQGAQLASWLRLLLPDLDQFDFPEDPSNAATLPEVTLRVLLDGDRLREARLDWQTTRFPNTLELPGFEVKFPEAQLWSLLTRREEEDDRLTLAVTLPSNSTLEAQTVFNLNRGNGDQLRELHHADKATSTPLAKLTLTAKDPTEPLSVALVDLPLRAPGRTTFLRQFSAPVLPLSFEQHSSLCEASPDELRRLDFTRSASLNLDLDLGNDPFALPILNKQDSSGIGQFLTLKPAKEKPPDPQAGEEKISTSFSAELKLGTQLTLSSAITLDFFWERFAFGIRDDVGIEFKLDAPQDRFTFLGFEWTFSPDPPTKRLFILTTKDANYELKQAPGSRITASFSRATSPQEPIVFEATNFGVSAGGVSFDAKVSSTPARLNGLDTRFQFTQGSLQVRDNRFTSFTIAGAGSLPPDLVGPAIADIALQFAQDAAGDVQLISASAELRGSKLLKCQATRFQFSIDGIGLRFVNDGRFHLYFTLTGKARYMPASDDTSGPLAWLGAVEIQMIDCPLAGDVRVLAQHIRFLVELPRKVTFSLLGCFSMELRAIGFLAQFPEFTDLPAAMELSGQIKFAEGAGDILDARVDFHNLYIALPPRGSILPRLHCKGLELKIKTGDAFELQGSVDFLDGDDVAPGISANGFRGKGSLTIMGLPTMAANFAFLRVSRDRITWVRAWFIYVEVRQLSLRIPVIEVFIREVGLGFGYRYTLASIKAADELDDPRALVRELGKLSLTQGNLAEASAWKVDLEDPIGTPRWTVALRALISQTSAAAGVTDWNQLAEENLACVFILDAVIALRSDLTFLMTARGWLYTNYNDFLTKESIRNGPLLSGFVLLSPPKKRFLAHFASNRGAEFGDHPPLFEFLKKALKDSYFSATLLIEPGLYHMEMGWPNMLKWEGKLGPLQVEFRGGFIFRVSTSEIVVGQSVMARGTLDLKAEVDLGFVGARLHAFATVAYGARYIGVISFDRPLEGSALYGAVGLEIQVELSIEFWLHLDFAFFSIDIDFGFSLHLGFTALLEAGVTAGNLIGVRGTATVTLGIMGYDLQFSIHVGLNEDAVNDALAITDPYLHIGMEAGEVEPIPGTTPTEPPAGPGGGGPGLVAAPALAGILAPVAGVAAAAPAAPPPPLKIVGPDYVILTIPAADGTGCYFLLLPAPDPPPGEARCGFLPVPPTDPHFGDTVDFEWTVPVAEPGIQIEHFTSPVGGTPGWTPLDLTLEKWRVRWEEEVPVFDRGKDQIPLPKTKEIRPPLGHLLRYCWLPDETVPKHEPSFLGDMVPISDPQSVELDKESAVEDERVRNPSEGNYEAAVRGATEQFQASPYLKGDSRSKYEQLLREAYSNNTTIYTDTGKVPPEGTPERKKMEHAQHVAELRSTFIRRFIADAHEYAAAEPAARAAMEEDLFVFKFGLLFRSTGGVPSFLKNGTGAGTIHQRTAPSEIKPQDARKGALRLFNIPETSFGKNPPDFDRLDHFVSSSTVAITWDLVWQFPQAVASSLSQAQTDPEQQLLHYHVRRQTLGDESASRDSSRDFFVKNVSALHRPDGASKLNVLLPRFKFVDHFEDETQEDVALLPAIGRIYIYTITPVDLGGTPSPKPATVVARRMPDLPPLVPADAVFTVRYELSAVPQPTATPLVQPPARVDLAFSPLPATDAQGRPQMAAAKYRLIFRQEKVLPIGSYAQDAASQGARTDGLATSNARPLRTDVILSFPDNEVRTVDGRRVLEIPLEKLKGILPEKQEWRPQAWRVFLQTESAIGIPSAPAPETESAEGIRSALAPVQLALRFRRVPLNPDQPRKDEERHPELLEWIATPLLASFLPPEDETAEAGMADVPRLDLDNRKNPTTPVVFDPPAAESLARSLDGLVFQQHPQKFRALRFRWNQASSAPLSYRRELHAAYELFEFDADAQTWPTEPEEPTVRQVLDRLRRVQEIQLLPPDDLSLRPAENLAPEQWEAWYPSTSRRLWLRSQPDLLTLPPQSSAALYSPWFSWRESYLKWPDDAPMQVAREALAGPPALPRIDDAAPQITVADQALKLSGGDLAPFQNKEGKLLFSYVVIRGAVDSENNGVKRVLSLDVPNRKVLFEKGSFTKDQSGNQGDNRKLTIEALPPQLPRIDDAAPQIIVADQALQLSVGDLAPFQKFSYVVIRGALASENNGVKRVLSLDVPNRKVLFEKGSFTKAQSGNQGDNRKLTIEALRPQLLHFFLIKLVDDLRRQADIEIDVAAGDTVFDGGALPTAHPGGPVVFMGETRPEHDPYGWNALKRMGLAVSFNLRSRKFGVPVTVPGPHTSKEAAEIYVGQLLKHVLAGYDFSQAAINGLQEFLHIEYLVQPGKSVRLEQDADKAPRESELLALVQISLRPIFRQAFSYQAYTITINEAPVNPSEKQTAKPAVELLVEPLGDGVLIDHSGAGETVELEEGKRQKLTVLPPVSGPIVLLTRTQKASPKIELVVPDPKVTITAQPFAPIDFLATRFTALPIKTWAPQEVDPNIDVTPPIAKAWAVFRRYFDQATRNEVAQSTSEPAPVKVEPALFLPWLQRFFDHAGDWDANPKGSAELRRTGPGPWLAVAYPRASTPAFAAPNAAGRIEYYHLIQDQWAHAYRYLIKPYGRYDRLWQSLQESRALEFPRPDDEPASPVASKGGVDVVLERIRPLAAPLVLSSRRLDRTTGTPAEPAEPGITWEVLVAKHPEQILIERNRSLERHLSYCQIAHTLLRRVVELEEQKVLFKATKEKFALPVVPVENRTEHSLPGAVTSPDEFQLETATPEELRSVALTERMDVFGRGALALQWEALPFFYEHRLILVAQATAVVSSITDLVHRDFHFQSPVPFATGEGLPLPPNEAGVNRALRLTIALNSYWDCTPPATRARWSIEDPASAAPRERRWSSLADPSVVYEVVIERPSAALESQAEVRFDANKDRPFPFITEQRGKLFKPAIGTVIGPVDSTDPFRLILDLKPLTDAVPKALTTVGEISSKSLFVGTAVADLVFPEPESLFLVLSGTLTSEEIAYLLTARVEGDVIIPRDASFCAAVRRLASEMGEGKLVTASACLGLEQLAEASAKAALDAEARTLSWRGALLPVEREFLTRFQERSNFRGIVKELVEALEGNDGPEIAVPLAGPPATPIPAVLASRLQVRTDATTGEQTLVWKGRLAILDAELSALDALATSADLGAGVRDIHAQLVAPSGSALAAFPVIAIPPNDDWQPRPDLLQETDPIPLALAKKLLLGRARISYPGPMLRRDAQALHDAAAASAADQQAILRLFQRSLSAGLAGGTLRLRARRSSAPAQPAVDIQVTL